MKQGAEFFNQTYFEQFEGDHKGNYTRVGGYAAHASQIPWDEVAKYLVQKAGGEFPHILDVGCAYGYLVRSIGEAGGFGYGIDISEYAVSQVANDVAKHCRVWDVSMAPPAPEIFGLQITFWDLVCSFDVMEHVENKEEAEQILASLHTVSKKQFHKVNTGQHYEQAFDGDKSHGLRMPLSEWQALALEVDPEGSITIVE